MFLNNYLKFKKVLISICFFAVFGITYVMVHLAVVDTDSSTRLAFHEFYRQPNIDLAVVGPSRVYHGFYPELADQILDLNTFNMGTASQTFDGSYYYLRELVKNYTPKVVYFDVEFDFLTRDIGQQKCSWILSDYMCGINRYRYIFDVFDKEEWSVMLSQIYRYKGDITSEYCTNNLRAKLNAGYWNYSTENEYYKNYNAYIGKGFANLKESDTKYTYFAYKDTYSQFDTVMTEKYNSEMTEYLIKSIQLCQDNGIEIVLITMPESDFYLSHAGNYQDFSDYVHAIASDYGVEYYDFNLLLTERFANSEFLNLDHLTIEGAKHFTRILCDLYKNGEKYVFSDNIEELSKNGIIGITYNLTKESDNTSFLQWNIESHNEAEYYVKVLEEIDDFIVYESEITSSSSASYPIIKNARVVLEIYDQSLKYLGNALLQ